MSDALAHEALLRAKAIAAKLKGETSESTAGKRKRWGVMPDDNDEDENAKRAKEAFQKRIWIVDKEKPAAHYVACLSDKLLPLQEQFQITIRLEGRGAGRPPVPGMPEQPLHVLLLGPSMEALLPAVPPVETLIQDAKEAALQVSETALANIPQTKINETTNYRPASVAQLIHGSDLPTDGITTEMGVPHNVVGFVIGRGGETIASLQAQTGVKVQIQRESEVAPGQSERILTLVAPTEEALEECKQRILKLIADKTGRKGMVLVEMEVPEEDVGLVIGKQGSTIRSIQEQTGANIQVPPDSQNGKRKVNISHTDSTGAEAAKQMIQDLLKSKAASTGPQGKQVTIQVPIPDQDVGLCIGRGGCVIRQMQNSTNARVQIPSAVNPGETHRIATVTGTQEGCDLVKRMIETIIVEQSSASVMSGAPFTGGQAGYNYYVPQDASQQAYSADWAAYRAAQQAAAQQQPTVVAAPAPAVQQQPAADAYYEQFFRYAYYYGEDAARQYYGAWSPPLGTPNPYGVNPNGVQSAPVAAPSSVPISIAAAGTAGPSAASNPVAVGTDIEARDTGRRKVSNLPAWMTKGS